VLDAMAGVEGEGVRELHGHEGLPAAAQRSGGLEVRPCLVDEQVEQFAVFLVLHDGVAGADNAQHVGLAGDRVGAHGGEVIGDGDRGDAVLGQIGGGECDGAHVPSAEACGGHGLFGGEAVAGDGAQAVPGVLAGGDEGRGAVGEGFDFVRHESFLSGCQAVSVGVVRELMGSAGR
jgi:hypothetical protein